MRLKPAMRYQLREYLVAGGFFWGISVVLMLLSIWLPLHFQLDEYQVYSWYGFSCTIFFLSLALFSQGKRPGCASRWGCHGELPTSAYT